MVLVPYLGPRTVTRCGIALKGSFVRLSERSVLSVNEEELLVSEPHRIVAGKAGRDRLPVAQHAGHRRSRSGRGDDAHLGGEVGAVILPDLRPVEDPGPRAVGPSGPT
jgi:hypothetical protein